MADQVLVALSTCPDAATADRVGRALVSEGLAACVNRVEGVRSTYFWDGRLQDEPEILLIIKTTAAMLAALTDRVRALHPYEVPELVAIPTAGGNEAYLQWVRTGVRTQGE
jgi:periplasmic divalent cation tolerance protein